MAIIPPVQPAAVRYRPVLEWQNGQVAIKYTVTDEDRIWFARAIWREGPPRAAVGHTLIQRFASIYPTYPTLTSFLRAYSQPINPAWFPTGARHKRSLDRLRRAGKTREAAAEIEAARRRVEYSNTPWESIPEQYRQLSDNLLAGNVSNPVPTAEHFSMSFATRGADNTTAQSEAESWAKRHGFGKPLAVPGGFGIGQNWFFETGKGYPPRVAFTMAQTVPGQPGTMLTRTITPGKGGTAAALAVAVAIGIVATRSKKR